MSDDLLRRLERNYMMTGALIDLIHLVESCLRSAVVPPRNAAVSYMKAWIEQERQAFIVTHSAPISEDSQPHREISWRELMPWIHLARKLDVILYNEHTQGYVGQMHTKIRNYHLSFDDVQLFPQMVASMEHLAASGLYFPSICYQFETAGCPTTDMFGEPGPAITPSARWPGHFREGSFLEVERDLDLPMPRFFSILDDIAVDTTYSYSMILHRASEVEKMHPNFTDLVATDLPSLME